jgi:two-component system sensor histidine kinase DesK
VALAGSPVGFFWALVSGVLLGDIVGGLRARWTVVWVLGAVGVVFSSGYMVMLQVFGEALWPSSLLLFFAGLAAFFVGSMWTLDFERLWWLKAVTDLDDSRRTAAELATARERLRLADDLHDILGHALEVVAFKSELASRLQGVDPDRARSEMEEVQRVARESLSEVRALVRDARSTDLVTELAGARAVLESAGVVLVVRGDPTALGPTARNVLGRVLREAMTNVLRHAQPSHCTIEIDVTDGRARLRVENDGALPADRAELGTGLDALGRYLDEHAGRLDAGPGPDGTFHVDAVLPGAAR